MAKDDGEFQLGKLIRLVAGLAVIVLLVQFALDGGSAELLRQLGMLGWMDWLALCGVSVLIVVALSSLFRTSIQVVHVELSYPAAFGYSAMNTFFNTILPMKGGLWVRGLYLKQRHDVSWANYLFVLATGTIIQLGLLATTAAGFYLAGRLPLYLPILPGTTVLAGLGLVAVLAVIAAIVLREPARTFSMKVARGMRLWISDPLRFLRYIVETLVMHGLTAFRLWLAFYYIGTTLSVAEICVLYAALAAGLSWAVTPGNLGVKEAGIVILAAILGIDTEAAVAASVVDRITALIITITVGGAAAYRVSASTASR